MTALICLQNRKSMSRPQRLLFSISRLLRRAAIPQSDTPSSILPETLESLLPDCSKACVRAFIVDNYSSSSFSDINALCTINTASGFTLGEAALICGSSYCAAVGQFDESVFSICNNIPQAIRPTHDSLTVVPMATSQLTLGSNAFSSALPSTIGAPAATGIDATRITTATGAPAAPPTPNPAPPPPSSSSPTSPSSSSTQAPSTSTSPSIPSSTPTTSPTPSQTGESNAFLTPDSSPTTAPTDPRAQGNLNTGQIVGISLAALAIFVFVIGFILFLYYRRRERGQARRGSRWSDVIEKHPPGPFLPGEHQLEGGFTNTTEVTAANSRRFYASRTTTQEKRRSFWRRSIKPEDIGVAVSPEMVQAGSPTSISSQRTTSQLLPALPNYSLWPTPIRKTQQVVESPERHREPLQPAVTFPSTFVQSKKTHKPLRIVSSRTGNGLPTDPRAHMYKMEQANGANSKIPLTPVYDNGNVPTTFGAILATRENIHLHTGQSSSLQPQRYYDPQPQSRMATQGASVGLQSTLAPPPPAHLQKAQPRQAPPLRRNSSASDSTSFEDDEDITPEQEKNRQLRPTPLSPVIESPRQSPSSPIERLTTPVRDLTYPTPPRSAAISKQAERQPRPRASQFFDTLATTGSPSHEPTSKAPSRRDQLVLDDRSFFSTASSSSPSRKREESPSSLLAKRKGDTAADQMLQRGFRLSSTTANVHAGNSWPINNQDESKVRKRSDTENIVNMALKTPPTQQQKGGLKSPPVWTPRLTPTRRGEYLYLRVE
jgi:hypothetical protein